MSSKEISRERYTRVLLSLIELHSDMKLNIHIDSGTIQVMQETIDMLRYYRQFSK